MKRTNLDEKKVIEAYSQNKNLEKTAQMFECASGSIKRVLERNNIPITGTASDGVKKMCPECGKEFIAYHKSKKYCSRYCVDSASKRRRGFTVNTDYENKEHVCAVCGKSFTDRDPRSKTCSKECADIYYSNRAKRRNKTDFDSNQTRECKVCGKIYNPKSYSQATCGNKECQKIWKKEAHKIRNQRWEERNQMKPMVFDNKLDYKPPVYEIRECVECGELFWARQKLSTKTCSKECSRKQKNRKRDKRIPKKQIVDKDISLKRLFKRDEGICWICGGLCNFNDQKYTPEGYIICFDEYPSVDHVIPIARGGLHSWENVRLAHKKCNTDKGTDLYPYVPLEYEFAYKESKKGTQAKETGQYTLDGKLLRIWESTGQIERELGFKSKHIQAVCRKCQSKTGNAYGYHWEYMENVRNEQKQT